MHPLSPLAQPPAVQRVMLIVPWMRLGGADRFNLSLVKELAARGVAVTVCATLAGEHPWQPEFARYTPDVHLLPQAARMEHYPRYLAQLIDARGIELVVITHAMLGYALLPYLRAVCPRAALVDYNHMVATVWRSGGYARLGASCQPYLDLNIVSSEQVKGWMVAQGADPARIEVCYTNLDTETWDPRRFDRAALRQQLNLRADQPVVIFPARLEPQKRPRVLAEVLRRLRQRGVPFQCLVAGDGSQTRWLKRFLVRHQLEACVRLLGPVAPDRMPELMAVSDVLLLPSRDEGIALTLFEAMAMGVVAVSADVGGQRELVTTETGFLIPHGRGEVAAYVSVLERLFASPALRAELGQAARARVCQHFTSAQMAERMLALFGQARQLARSAPRAPVDLAEGEVVAQRAIANVQLDRLQEQLRLGPSGQALSAEGAAKTPWQRLIYQLKKRMLRPLYYWGLEQGFEWWEPLANQVYHLLQRVLR